ncbi:ATP-binding protein [Rhabdobacter roseus]|uniref:ATP/GTP-binding protein n=1 Tax=Rhabdobacter roseus TaxID=1655419 RepID=A0A840TSK0_9BACT|nr:ATP/GTP-binding protein [Rhabdobacter roseus]MBB5284677.1 hypothetical protein [Rhabdobacter roseus]
MNHKHLALLASLAIFSACGSSNQDNAADNDQDTTATAESTLELLWSTDSTLQVPESVLFDGQSQVLYVSQIDGKPDGKDNQGGIAKVGLDGQIIDLDWVTGLSAPKGMGMGGGYLYVTDLTELVQIDLANGKITKKIPVAGAQALNDVSVDGQGNVYFTDKSAGKIHLLKDGQVSTYHEGADNPNGVLAVSDGVLFAASGSLYKLDANKNLTTLAEGMDKSTDGIEEIAPGEYLVSCWSGYVYHVKADGTTTTLLDTSADKVNSADIGYDAAKRIVYVPTFYKKSVMAYQLK